MNTLRPFLVCCLCGCASSALSRAPESPRAAWAGESPAPPDGLSLASNHLLAEDPDLLGPPPLTAFDPNHVYTLPELIDLAQSNQPETRVAWEKARQAALAVGMARAEYLPWLTATVLAGFQHTQHPIPVTPLTQDGFFSTDTYEVIPALGVKWLLFDFGGRGAQIVAAEQLSLAANAIYSGAHQKIVLDVTKAYHRCNAALAQVKVATTALEHAKVFLDATTMRQTQGLATVIERAEVDRQVAQARYNLAQVEALRTTAQAELLEAIGGARATAEIRVLPNPSHPLPATLGARLEDILTAMSRRRPDLVAAMARIRGESARVDHARSLLLPRLAFAGALSREYLGVSIEGRDYTTRSLPTASALFTLEWVLFDGGLRSAKVKLQESRRAEAQAELVRLQNQAVRQIIIAYNEVRSGLSRHEAARALAAAADLAMDAATEAFKAGVGGYAEALRGENASYHAHLLEEQVYAEVMTAAAALAFATGGAISVTEADTTMTSGGLPRLR